MQNLSPEVLSHITSRGELSVGLEAVSRNFISKSGKEPLFARHLLSQSYQITYEKDWNDVKEKALILREIAKQIASFDPKLSLKIIDSFPDSVEKSSIQLEIVKQVLMFDKERAKCIAKSINTPLYKAEALMYVAQEFAIEGLNPALEIISNLEDDLRVDALIRIAKIRFIFDSEQALELVESFTKISDKIRAYGEIIKSVESKDKANILLTRVEQLINLLPDDKEKAKMIVDTALFFLPLDLTKAINFASEALLLETKLSGTSRGVLLTSLIKIFIRYDIFRAFETFDMIKDLNYMDIARLEFVQYFLENDLSQAETFALSVKNPDLKDLALRDLGIAYAAFNIDKAKEIAELIKNEKVKNYLQREIVRKLKITEPQEAFSITKSLSDPYQILALSDILKTQDLSQVEAYVDSLDNTLSKAVMALELAKGSAADFASKMLHLAATVVENCVGNYFERAKMLNEIAAILSSR